MDNKKIFEAVDEKHDGKGRIVFLCKDAYGFYVYKPGTGFKSRHWLEQDDKHLVACFDRQVICTQNHGFLEKGEAPKKGEVYSMVPPTPPAPPAGTGGTGTGDDGQKKS